MHKKQNSKSITVSLYGFVADSLCVPYQKRSSSDAYSCTSRLLLCNLSMGKKKKSCDLPISDNPGLHTCVVYCAADKSLLLVLFPWPAATGCYLTCDLSEENWEGLEKQLIKSRESFKFWFQHWFFHKNMIYIQTHFIYKFMLLEFSSCCLGLLQYVGEVVICVSHSLWLVIYMPPSQWTSRQWMVRWIMGLCSDNALRLNLYSLPLDRFAAHMYWHVITRPLRNAHAGFDGQL